MRNQARRLLIAVFVAVLLAAPLAAEAQPAGKVYRLGFLQTSPNTPAMNFTEAFRQRLRDHGYLEGQNIVIEHRMSSALKENPALLADLVSRKVDVIFTWGTPALLAAKKATSTIPIVGISGNPDRTGLVASLARPGGNYTGLAILSEELELKNLQLLKEIVPRVTRVAVLWNPDDPAWTHVLKRLHEAAPALGVKLQPLAVRESGDLEAAFAAATREKAAALLVVREASFVAHRQRIADLAATHRLPAIYGSRIYIEVGGLMSYGASVLDMLRRAAAYVDKILKGAKLGDLPVEQPTKLELVVNLRAAKAIGLTIPPSLLQRADRVLE